ncbi:MAG: hypothetical protein ABSA69_05455 [Verrucomicrobiota bacterium]
MNTRSVHPFLLPVLLAGLGMMLPGRAPAQNLTALHHFTDGSDGANPWVGLILSGNFLYGTTQNGGTNGHGTVFALSLVAPPSIGITTVGNHIILSWPTNAIGYTVQSIANLSSGIWFTVANGTAIVGASYVYSNSASGSVLFYRLIR